MKTWKSIIRLLMLVFLVYYFARHMGYLNVDLMIKYAEIISASFSDCSITLREFLFGVFSDCFFLAFIAPNSFRCFKTSSIRFRSSCRKYKREARTEGLPINFRIRAMGFVRLRKKCMNVQIRKNTSWSNPNQWLHIGRTNLRNVENYVNFSYPYDVS